MNHEHVTPQVCLLHEDQEILKQPELALPQVVGERVPARVQEKWSWHGVSLQQFAIKTV